MQGEDDGVLLQQLWQTDSDGRAALSKLRTCRGRSIRWRKRRASFRVTTAPGAFAYNAGTWTPGWIVATGDLNGDGHADVLLYDPETGQAVRCLTTKPGQFQYVSESWLRGIGITGPVR